jgi:hypothetical protein
MKFRAWSLQSVEKYHSARLTSGQFHVGKVLPFVHGNEPCISLATATQIDDKFRSVVIQSLEYRLQPIQREFTGGEEEGCDDNLVTQSFSIRSTLNIVCSSSLSIKPHTPERTDDENNQRKHSHKTHLTSTPLNPLPSILILDPTTNLQMPRPSFTSLSAGILIARSQHNHMRTLQCIFLVELCIVR